MAFLLDGNPLAVDVPFTYGDINYPANWLRLSTADEKTALGITEVADSPTYDSRFYWGDGTARTVDDVNATDENGDLLKTTIDGLGTLENTCIKIQNHSNTEFLPEFLKARIPKEDE